MVKTGSNTASGNRRGHNNNRRYERNNDEPKLFSEVIELKRVAKVTAGAKRLRFSAVVAVGNKNGRIGIAMGRGMDPQEALQKAIKKATDSAFTINIENKKKTIPHRVEAAYKASEVIIKPAPVGTGVVAGGSVRKILELSGVENVVSKSLGTNNAITNAYCALIALSKLKKMNNVVRTAKTTKES
ncbi:MAG: 30S ribosomal protein S5 [Candidatus Dojkabacteria bacterium]|nr:MAG: 30S ribosomal protein S5 [Candidatus Dojkabacteria bacterium]